MKKLALLVAGMVSAMLFAMSSLANKTNMFVRDETISSEIQVAATNWKLPAGRTVEWAVFGSG